MDTEKEWLARGFRVLLTFGAFYGVGFWSVMTRFSSMVSGKK